MLIHKARISSNFSAEWHFTPEEGDTQANLEVVWDPDVPNQFAFMVDPELWPRYQKARRKAMRKWCWRRAWKWRFEALEGAGR